MITYNDEGYIVTCPKCGSGDLIKNGLNDAKNPKLRWKCNDCNYKTVEKHYPIWNGTCVPVTCPVSDDVKELYNITYEIIVIPKNHFIYYCSTKNYELQISST